MKITAKISRVIKGSPALVEFSVPNYQASWLEEYKDKELTLTITDKKENKTNQQNRYAWKLISMIDNKINGFRSDEMQIYKMILKQANIDPIYLEGLQATQTALEQTFRVVEVIESRTSQKGVETLLFKCYKGISLLTKEEMSDLIEVILQYCQEYEIEVEREMFE